MIDGVERPRVASVAAVAVVIFSSPMAIASSACGGDAETAEHATEASSSGGASSSASGASRETTSARVAPVFATQGALRFHMPSIGGVCRVIGGEDEVEVEVYTYDGAPTSCVVPMFLLETGVFGCPTSVALESRPDRPITFEYDAEGRMRRADETTYQWEADRLVSITRLSQTQPVQQRELEVWIGDEAAPEMSVTLGDRGWPERIRRFAAGNLFSDTTLAYEAERLTTCTTRFAGSGGARTLHVEMCATGAGTRGPAR